VINAEAAVVGYATCYGAHSHVAAFTPHSFTRFLATGLGAHLRLDHQPIINSRGVQDHIGTIRQFASITHPQPGLLALGSFNNTEAGQGLRDAVAGDLYEWGLSVGVWAYDGEAWGIGEVSLTRNPAHRMARVLAIGPTAIRTWELLTGIETNHGVEALPR
jgi:hypothetical protein